MTCVNFCTVPYWSSATMLGAHAIPLRHSLTII
jgi:hypothetical protein